MNAQRNVRQFEKVKLEDITYGEWSAQPTVAEIVQIGQQGVTPWVNETKKINPALDESECEHFLRWIAKHLHYRFSTNVEAQMKLAKRMGVPSKRRKKGKKTKLSADQERALTGFWLWQYNEHITVQTIAEVINRHMSTESRIPYVHSKAHDKCLMIGIANDIANELSSLERVQVDKILENPPENRCARPEVPSHDDPIDTFSNIEDSDADTDEDPDFNKHIDALARMTFDDTLSLNTMD